MTAKNTLDKLVDNSNVTPEELRNLYTEIFSHEEKMRPNEDRTRLFLMLGKALNRNLDNETSLDIAMNGLKNIVHGKRYTYTSFSTEEREALLKTIVTAIKSDKNTENTLEALFAFHVHRIDLSIDFPFFPSSYDNKFPNDKEAQEIFKTAISSGKCSSRLLAAIYGCCNSINNGNEEIIKQALTLDNNDAVCLESAYKAISNSFPREEGINFIVETAKKNKDQALPAACLYVRSILDDPFSPKLPKTAYDKAQELVAIAVESLGTRQEKTKEQLAHLPQDSEYQASAKLLKEQELSDRYDLSIGILVLDKLKRPDFLNETLEDRANTDRTLRDAYDKIDKILCPHILTTEGFMRTIYHVAEFHKKDPKILTMTQEVLKAKIAPVVRLIDSLENMKKNNIMHNIQLDNTGRQ